MDKVCVFLSTYNGEKYLRRQIDSILHQEGISLSLMIRDDGSTDHTCDILKEYEEKYSEITVYYGENVGYIRSFMWLVTNCPPLDNTFYAFSDQDDVWDEKKLRAAVSKIRERDSSIPVAYYSDLDVVDQNENFIRKANAWEGSITKYKIAVFIGIRGCTMVYNNVLQKLLYHTKTGDISGHDTYVALIAFWLGEMIYDDHAYIKYRQTGENLSITGTSSKDKLFKNFLYVKKRLTVRKNIHEKNAKEVLLHYEDQFPEQLEELHLVADYRKSIIKKFRLLTNRKFKDFSILINVFNDIFIILGKL